MILITGRATYGMPFDADFLDYLRKLSYSERRAFDMAMGYVFGKISDLHIKLPKDGLYISSKASNAEPEPFYNAHRDRSDLFETQITFDKWRPIEFPKLHDGWDAPLFNCKQIPSRKLNSISQHTCRVAGETTEAGVSRKRCRFIRVFIVGLWLVEVEIYVPESIQHKVDLEIRADRIWQPFHILKALTIANCRLPSATSRFIAKANQ